MLNLQFYDNILTCTQTCACTQFLKFLFSFVDEAEMQDLVQGHMTSEQGQTLRPPEVVITDADDVDDVIDGAMMSVVAVAKPGT